MRAEGGVEEVLFAPGGGPPLFVYAVACWLLLRRRHKLQRSLGRAPAVWPAILLFTFASALGLWSSYVGVPDLLIPSLIAMVLAAALWLGGWAAFRSVLFPAFFLLFLVRVPPILYNQIIYPLQLVTAATAAWILGIIGETPHVVGDLIVMPERVFHVIESCAGFRFAETFLMASLLYVELFYRNRVQAIFLIAIAIPLSMFFNTLRVVTIVLNPFSELIGMHSLQGIVVLVLGILTMAGIDALMGRFQKDLSPSRGPEGLGANTVERKPLLMWRLVALGCALTFLGGSRVLLPRATVERVSGVPLYTLAASFDGWKADGLPIDRVFLGSVHFNKSVHRRYEREGAQVDIFLGDQDRDDRRTSIVSPKNLTLEAGASVVECETLKIPGSRGAEAAVIRKPSGIELTYLWYTGYDSFLTEFFRYLLALDQSGFREAQRAIVHRISTPISRGPHGLIEAHERLRRFLPLYSHQLQTSGILTQAAL